MKRFYLLLSIVVAIMCSCSKSPEQKAEELIQKELKKTLYKPDTYQSVSTEALNISGHGDNFLIHAAIRDAETIFKDIRKCQSELELNQSTMNIWKGPYMDSFSSNEYNNSKEKCDKLEKQLAETREEAKSKVNVLLLLFNTKPESMGHKYLHNYRANNNLGNTLIGNMIFFVDDKCEKVLYADESESYSKYVNIINGLTRKIKPKLQYSDEEIEEAMDYLIDNTKEEFSLF